MSDHEFIDMDIAHVDARSYTMTALRELAITLAPGTTVLVVYADIAVAS